MTRTPNSQVMVMIDEELRQRIVKKLRYLKEDLEDISDDFDRLLLVDGRTPAMEAWWYIGHGVLELDAKAVINRVDSALYHCDDDFYNNHSED